MKDNELLFDRKSHVLYSKPCKNEIQATTRTGDRRCENGRSLDCCAGFAL